MIRTSLAVLLLFLLATPTGGRPVLIHSYEVHHPSFPSTHSMSVWTVTSLNSNLLMHWKCTPFEPLVDESIACDAFLSLRSLQQSQRTKVVRSFDRTDISDGRDEAAVIAKSYYQQVNRFQLMVGIDGRDCPAGSYCTTVNLTVSAH